MFESLIHIDHWFFDFINQGLSNPFFDGLMPFVRNKKTWIPFYILGALVLFKVEKKKAFWIILFSIISVSLSDLVSSHFLKNFFIRTRPCLLEGFTDHVNLVIDRCSGAYSFPSSHAANHFALAIFLSLVYYRKRLFKTGILFWAAMISFAQVYVGVHFPLDIVGGILVGLLTAMISFYVYQRVTK